MVKNLSSNESTQLVESIHRKEYGGKHIFCNGLIPLTPPKEPVQNNQAAVLTHSDNVAVSSPPDVEVTADLDNLVQKDASDVEDLVIRHSLSLLNRTPPVDSIANELLSVAPRPNLEKAQKMLSELKESLSDFGSCLSDHTDNDSGGPPSDKETKFNSDKKNDKKKKKKRKQKFSPESALAKKPNLVNIA